MTIDPRVHQYPQDGLNTQLGFEFAEATAQRVVLTVEVDDRHRQPYGLVHGGVYCAMAETAASVGAALASADLDDARGAVGVSNRTDFLRATREGTLTATATPLQVGRRLQLWQVRTTTDDGGDDVAHSLVRLSNVRRPPRPDA